MAFATKFKRILVLIAMGMLVGCTHIYVPRPVAIYDGRLIYTRVVIAYSSKLTPQQKQNYRDALEVWNRALDRGFKVEEIPNTLGALNQVEGQRFLGKCIPVMVVTVVDHNDEEVINEDKKKTNQTVGLTDYSECGASRIKLVIDRLESREKFIAVAAHEIGHGLGLDHVDGHAGSIMNTTWTDAVKQCLTPEDVEALCNRWGCVEADVRLCG